MIKTKSIALAVPLAIFILSLAPATTWAKETPASPEADAALANVPAQSPANPGLPRTVRPVAKKRPGWQNRHKSRGVKAIVDTIEEKCPTTRILILGIFPRGNDDKDRRRIVNMKANEIISTFADKRTIFYQDIGGAFLDENRVLARDIMPDLLHPNTKGYEIWAEAMEEKLKGLMEDS